MQVAGEDPVGALDGLQRGRRIEAQHPVVIDSVWRQGYVHRLVAEFQDEVIACPKDTRGPSRPACATRGAAPDWVALGHRRPAHDGRPTGAPPTRDHTRTTPDCRTVPVWDRQSGRRGRLAMAGPDGASPSQTPKTVRPPLPVVRCRPRGPREPSRPRPTGGEHGAVPPAPAAPAASSTADLRGVGSEAASAAGAGPVAARVESEIGPSEPREMQALFYGAWWCWPGSWRS